MHYKNQIDTVLASLEILQSQVKFIAQNEDDKDELFDKVHTALLRVDSIIDHDYTTNHLQNAYNNPVEEAIHQLHNATYAIEKYQRNKLS